MDYILLGELTQVRFEVSERLTGKGFFGSSRFPTFGLRMKYQEQLYFCMDGSKMELHSVTLNFLRYTLTAPLLDPPNYGLRSSRELSGTEIIAAIDGYLRRVKIENLQTTSHV